MAPEPGFDPPNMDKDAEFRRKSFGTYLLILAGFLSVQFGHGSNIGVAVSLEGDSKAMNLALGSWVMVGVCLGLPLTPWVCRTFGAFRVCCVCLIVDLAVILLMLWPDISLHQIYAVRFLVGFFEAPLLPYLQEWLARFGKHDWNVWNTVLHAMVPIGENVGYLVAQELVACGVSWQWAFAGQAAVLFVAVIACVTYSGRKYLDIEASGGRRHAYFSEGPDQTGTPLTNMGEEAFENNGQGGNQLEGEDDLTKTVEYPVTERWAVFWATNASLASELGFLSGAKYVIRDFALSHGSSLHFVLFAFPLIALCGPAIGGAVAMSGSILRPDQWSTHKRTLLFLCGTSALAAGLAVSLLITPTFAFWPALFACFVAAGGVYPAAQGIINIALTETKVIEASVYQVQCNNLLFAMPMPYAIGKSMDLWGVDTSFHCVIAIQVLAAAGFAMSLVLAACTEERSTWNRLAFAPRMRSVTEDEPAQ